MDFALSEEQRLLQRSVREVAERELKPRGKDLDATGEFPWDSVRLLGRMGLLGMLVPKAYGGAEVDSLGYALACEELARACASTATVVVAANSLAAAPILRWGSEEQKRRYLPRFAAGDYLGALALTEPQAGSDASALRTTAVRDGDAYVLNGSKVFATCGNVADVVVTFAMTDPAAGTKGMTAFLVDKGTRGFAPGAGEEKMGLHASPTVPIAIENCRVRDSNRLGAEGDGYKIALSTLDGGRIGVSAMAVGIAQACLEASVAYAKQRRAFGRAIAEFQAIQFHLADMRVRLDAARSLVMRAAALRDRGERATKEASMAKLFASQAATWIASKAVQIHGGYGYIKDYEVERHFRDIKVFEIFEGTNEVQRLLIARHLGLVG